MNKIKMMMELYEMTLEEALEKEDEVVVLDLEKPSFFELGYVYVHDYVGDISGVPKQLLETYFDYEAFGRDLVISDEFRITKDGKKGVSHP